MLTITSIIAIIAGKTCCVEYLLFVGYLLLLAWLVTKVKFFTHSGLTNSQLIIIFLLKVLAGIFYGWIGIYYGGYATMWDTWAFHANGLYEYHLLQTDPHEYLVNIFRNGYEHGYTRFFEAEGSFWNDLKGNIFIKLLSVFNVLSFGNYYVNVIFYSFITLFGAIAFFRVMHDAFPGRKTVLLLAAFMIPSFIYWTSGIHKEGLIFTGIALCTYSVYFYGKAQHFTLRKIIVLFCGMLLVLLLRNFLVALLFPAILTWIIANKFPTKSKLIFNGLYALFIVLFFTSKFILPGLDLPQSVVNKQKEFITLKEGRTTVIIRELEPDAKSFLINLPQAVNLTFLRPGPKDVHHLLSLASALEVYLFLFLFLLFLWQKSDFSPQSRNLQYFCLFFSITVLLSIGYSNNNIGAIVRYRSVVLPFLLTPMIAHINWQKILSMIKLHIK